MRTLTHPRLSKGGNRMPLIFITNENTKDLFWGNEESKGCFYGELAPPTILEELVMG
jgi:hypothetical protein